jgi:hypothetical protein
MRTNFDELVLVKKKKKKNKISTIAFEITQIRRDVRQIVPRACKCNKYRSSDEHNTKIGSKEK